jgi:acyl-CoA thioester hydrolase
VRPGRFPPGAAVRTVRARVRYGETDQMGVVYHPNFIRYFEMGRTEFMRSAGITYRELEEKGILLVVVEATARYHANVGYDEEIVIRTVVGEVGPATVTFLYEIEDARGRLLCDGSTRLASCNRDKKPVRLPAAVAAISR